MLGLHSAGRRLTFPYPGRSRPGQAPSRVSHVRHVILPQLAPAEPVGHASSRPCRLLPGALAASSSQPDSHTGQQALQVQPEPPVSFLASFPSELSSLLRFRPSPRSSASVSSPIHTHSFSFRPQTTLMFPYYLCLLLDTPSSVPISRSALAYLRLFPLQHHCSPSAARDPSSAPFACRSSFFATTQCEMVLEGRSSSGAAARTGPALVRRSQA